MKRFRMSRHSSKKNFSRNAGKTHKFNVCSSATARGGIRL